VEVGNQNRSDEEAGEGYGNVGDVDTSSMELQLMQDDGKDSASSQRGGVHETLGSSRKRVKGGLS